MKQLTCEMCGSTDLLKQDGVFVCQSCGTKYSVEEAKKMMIEGTVEVQGTVRIDDSAKYNNVLQLAEDAFVDGRWDSAYSYCNEALTIRPNAPLIIAMQGLSVLGKERIVTDVPTSSTNAMKRMFAVIDIDQASALDKIDILTKISNYLDQVCEAKKAELEEEIKICNSQKVDYNPSQETLAVAMAAINVIGGSVLTQQQANADLEKEKAKRLHNEALDAQISKINSRKKSVETFNSVYKQEIATKKREFEAKEKEERRVAYWAENPDGKERLEVEFETLQKQISELDAELNRLVSEKNKEIAEIPENTEIVDIDKRIEKLINDQKELGWFKIKEKNAIQKQIDQLYIQSNGIRIRVSAKKRDIEEKIAVAKADAQKEIAPLQHRIDEISAELKYYEIAWSQDKTLTD